MAVLTFNDAAHLLRRSGFAAHYGTISSMVGMTREAAADQVLNVSGAPSPTAGLPNLDKSRDSWPKYSEMVWFWADRAATSPTPIIEKLTLFWHGLLPTSLNKVFHHQQLMDQNTLYRTAGMGSIHDLYQAMAVQPAMLRYLDNADNVAAAPNENFARELMELFLLGANNGYTEEDVRASALAWSGHILDSTDEFYVFDASKHHNAATTFMGVNKVWNGPEIITHLINGAKQTEVSLFLARKLWSFFAYPNPPASVVDTVAGAMRSGGMRTDAALRAIFTHPDFYSTTAKQGLVRSPFEFVVAAMAHTATPANVAHPEWYGFDMGQAVFEPPNVAGWRSNQYWISSAAAWSKHQFANNLRWKLNKTNVLQDVELLAPRQAAEQALAQFGVYQPSARTLDSLTQFVSAERSAKGWGERTGLLFLPVLTPDFQMA
ncbi:MAG: DUF1800 family protein [Acidimicrobiales bacterium]